jgi:hypothetical protein
MSDRCVHCGEPALESDTVCWHCGMPLPGREESKAPQKQVKEGWQQSSPPATVAMYAGITIAVILAAFLVMVYLGRLPLLQIRFGTRAPDQWETIVSADNGFILSLPGSWGWTDGTIEDQAMAINDLLGADNKYGFGTFPFGAEVDDLKIQFIAEPSSPPGNQLSPFLVIARSRLLNRLTYEEAVDFLLTSDYRVKEARFVDNFDKSHVSIIVQTSLAEDLELNCRQQFILGESEAMLVSLCSPSSRYQANIATFEGILESFQRLDA